MFARRVTQNYAYSQFKYELWLSDYERLKFEIQAVKDIDMATWDKTSSEYFFIIIKINNQPTDKVP